jgi:hypothetical protein
MKVGNGGRRQGRRNSWLYAAGVSLFFVTAITWLGAMFDHPIDGAIVTGMTSPECGTIGRAPPGSVLLAALPDEDVCRSFYLYRATDQNAASDAHAYVSAIMHEWVAEFWRRIGYVLLLWLIVTAAIIGGVALVKRLLTRHLHHL